MPPKRTIAARPKLVHIDICRRACLVALVVGTVLNLINQGDFIFTGGGVDATKLILTYLVPFFVSAHGGFSGRKLAQLETQKTSKELA